MSRHIPKKELAWRRSRRVFKTGEFERIEREAARKYHSKKIGREVAGAAYWRTLDARYRAAMARKRTKRNPSRRVEPAKRMSTPHRKHFRVQVHRRDEWVTLALFRDRTAAIDYARALHRRHGDKLIRVYQS